MFGSHVRPAIKICDRRAQFLCNNGAILVQTLFAPSDIIVWIFCEFEIFPAAGQILAHAMTSEKSLVLAISGFVYWTKFSSGLSTHRQLCALVLIVDSLYFALKSSYLFLFWGNLAAGSFFDIAWSLIMSAACDETDIDGVDKKITATLKTNGKSFRVCFWSAIMQVSCLEPRFNRASRSDNARSSEGWNILDFEVETFRTWCHPGWWNGPWKNLSGM